MNQSAADHLAQQCGIEPAIPLMKQAYWLNQGVTQELVREPMPSGVGMGFRVITRKHGAEVNIQTMEPYAQ